MMTKEMSDEILQASHLHYEIHIRLAGVIDLIAAEAKYNLSVLYLPIRLSLVASVK